MSGILSSVLALAVFAISANGSPIISGQVTVNVDTSSAPDLANYGQQIKQIMETWFPFVETIMYSPSYVPVTSITLKFDPENTGVCGASFVDRFISCNPEFFRQNPTDTGAFIHEMTHVIHQAIGQCPGWVVEGIAEWTRRWHFQPWTKGDKPREGDGLDGGSGKWLLVYLNSDISGKPMIYHLNEACRQGTFNSNTIRDLTGKSEEEWFRELKSDSRVPWD